MIISKQLNLINLIKEIFYNNISLLYDIEEETTSI